MSHACPEHCGDERIDLRRAVSFALRARVGRSRANEMLARALGRVDGTTTLRVALESDTIGAVLSRDDIDALFDVHGHLGVAEETARRVAAAARESMASAVTSG